MDKMLEAARTIATARRDRRPLQALDPEIAPRDEAEGYRIQDAVHAVLAAEVGPLVGYKIGCTSQVMQRYLGIPHPCGGGVFAKGVHSSGVSLRHGDFVRVGVECEIAVRLARDLTPSGTAFTADTVAPAIDAYHPAIEIVDDRYADWRSIGAPTLVADDFSPPAACSAGPCRVRRRRICSAWSVAP
jgi:2-oxo-3-hexenedioate decarboxylase/2-keto-4-pentenoate hydratase